MLVVYIALGAFIFDGVILLAADKMAESKSSTKYF